MRVKSTARTTRKPTKKSFRPTDQKLADSIERLCQRSLKTRKGVTSPVQARPVLVGDLLKHHLLVGINCPSTAMEASTEAVADFVEDWAVKLLLLADTIRERRYR